MLSWTVHLHTLQSSSFFKSLSVELQLIIIQTLSRRFRHVIIEPNDFSSTVSSSDPRFDFLFPSVSRFLLPPELVIFYPSAPRGDSAGLFRPWLFILVGGFRLDIAAGCGANCLYHRTSRRGKHFTWLGEKSGEGVGWKIKTACQFGSTANRPQKQQCSKEIFVRALNVTLE